MLDIIGFIVLLYADPLVVFFAIYEGQNHANLHWNLWKWTKRLHVCITTSSIFVYVLFSDCNILDASSVSWYAQYNSS